MIELPYTTAARSILTTVLVCMISLYSAAQNVTETRWYFGNSSENLVFDRNGRDVYLQDDQATPFGSGGAATITDQFTGNLLFYTDGVNIYDATHSLVPSNAGMIANSSINVPVVTCPVSGNPGQYYLFANPGVNAPNEIQYTIVDASVAGNGTAQFPYGDIISSNNGTGLVNPSEGMLIIPAGDGQLFWLLTQNRTTFQIQVTRVDNGGIGATTNYDFTNGSRPGFEASHFAFNRDSSQLVMVPRTANRNVWLMGFDAATGIPTFDRTLTGTGFNDGSATSIYDAEWSPDGSKLYLSRFGGAGTVGMVYQIDFNDSTESVTPVLTASVFRSYGLKRAIDDRIYHLYQQTNATSPFTIGRINRPDSVADSVNYRSRVFNADFTSTQFSEFTPGYDFSFDTLNFYWIDSCETNVTKFFPIVEPVPNSLTWDFGDGGNSNNWIPNYQYQAAGGFMVSLTAEVGGITQTITQPVEILTNSLMVNLGNDTTICVDEVLTLDAGTGQSFVWSTGATTQTIEVDTTGTYWVEVTDASGCTGFDDIEVLEYGVIESVANQWYFGEQAGIEFNNGPIAILDGNNQDAAEGCATISDINGDLLFYTNGVTVWNKEHEVMNNGNSIGGDETSAQSALIMPFSDDGTMFYIFTTEEVYGDDNYALRYSIVDMKEDAALGKVVVKNIKLMDNSTERVTGSGFTGNDVIVSHEFGNNMFRSYRTSPNGLSGAIFSPVGEVHDFMNELSATGYMKISPTLAQIAVNIPGTNQVEILDFNQGEVSNPRLIDTGESDLYGMEFSPGGTKLYLTTSSKLIQYDLDSLNSANPAADIEATKFDGYTQGANYGALQLDPNGTTIYMAVDNSGNLGTISAPELDDASASFNPTGFDLQGRTSRLGLPNFGQNQSTPVQLPSITVAASCAGQASSFSAVGRDPNNSIENYLWIFGDGTSASAQDTTHVYTNPGTYNVQMVLSNRCDVDTTLSTTITINTISEQPIVPTDTALCDQPIVLTAWPIDDSNLTYYWSTGENTRQITVNNPAIIDVAIINLTTGCSSDTLQVFLADARPDIDLGGDRIICQNDPSEILDAQVVNATYSWAIDGVTLGTNRTFNIDTASAGIFEYTLEVTNSFGCVGRDTIQVTVLEEPDISFVGNATNGCGLNDGYIDLTFNTSGSYSYEISGPVNAGPFNADGPVSVSIPSGVPPATGNLLPGNYTLNVTNLVTGCTRNEIVQIEDPGALGLSVTAPSACIGDGEISLNFTSPPANFNLQIDYQDGSSIVNTSLSSLFTNPVAPNLDTGTYFIQVTDLGGAGCVETEAVRISLLNPQPDFTFDAIQEICSSQGRVGVLDNSGATYTWAPTAGIVGANVGDSITVNQGGTYTVVASGAGFCPRTETIEVIFNLDPSVTITTSGDPCEGQITLIAEVNGGSGSYFFNWNDGDQAQQHTVTTSGTYNVTVTDQFTGCEVISADQVVTVESEFEVVLTLAPNCDDNGQVFVIATTNYYDPSITYTWLDGNGNTLSEMDSVLTITQSDEYTVIATNETGTCLVSDVIDAPVVPILPEDLVLPSRIAYCTADVTNPTVDLDPGIFNTYEWRLLPDQAVISTNQVLTVSTEGTYEVTLYNGFTCITDQVQVVEDCRPIIFAPNAFSPNGNGVNDEFFVFPNDYVDTFEILIYTRWGELVFRSQNQNFRWNGVFKGKLLPPGTYAYIMKFTSSQGPELGTIEQFGSVTLIR